jgi:D-methionine transport system substrate-binding protein
MFFMNLKKYLSLVAATVVTVTSLASCASTSSNSKVITVGASPSPHAEILEYIKPQLKAAGYDLKIVTYQDYVQPNKALTDKQLDANYFQHQPYLTDYNKKNSTDIVSAGAIHYEPLGIYPGKLKSLSDLKEGSSIAIPNDTTNEARALLLLEANNLIKIDESKGLSATIKDITENTKKLKFVELDAAQIGRSLKDVDLAVINGNYAIDAGLSVSKDTLAKEDASSIAAQTYANIIAVRKGDENSAKIKALVAALKSEKTKSWITDKYKGSVVPTK